MFILSQSDNLNLAVSFKARAKSAKNPRRVSDD